MLLSIVFMLALIAVGVLFMYRAVSGRIRSKKAQTWPTVKGKILASEVMEDRLRSATGKATIAFIPDVSYEYIVNGQAHTGKSIIFGETVHDYISASRICEKFAVDTETKVYYNPARPEESVLLPQATEGLRSLVPGIFFIVSGILIGVMGVVFPN